MKEFGPSYMNGKRLESTQIVFVKSAKKFFYKKIRENKRPRRQDKSKKSWEKVKGTKNINSIKSAKKRILIPKVKNKEGEAVKTTQGIANVFAKFYEDLYVGEEENDGGNAMMNEDLIASPIVTVRESSAIMLAISLPPDHPAVSYMDCLDNAYIRLSVQSEEKS